jgi:hypothetical protein
MKIFEEDDHMMKDGGLDFQIADIQDGAVHEIMEYNFPWLELAIRNQDGCSSPGCKNLNLIQTFVTTCLLQKGISENFQFLHVSL